MNLCWMVMLTNFVLVLARSGRRSRSQPQQGLGHPLRKRMNMDSERRVNWLTKEDIKEILSETMQMHMQSDQHKFVEMLMAKEKRNQELWEKIKAHVLGWGAVAVIVFFCNMFWTELLSVVLSKKG